MLLLYFFRLGVTGNWVYKFNTIRETAHDVPNISYPFLIEHSGQHYGKLTMQETKQ